MGWFANTLESIKQVAAPAPIECPRGWGQVAFLTSIWIVPPIGGVDRSCPIAGVNSCGECGYVSNPDAFRLSEHVAELVTLRDAGHLDEREFNKRRAALVHLHPDGRGRALLVTAWVLGPLGLLVTAAGLVLATAQNAGFWGLAGGGAVMLTLAFSFFMLARSRAPTTRD